MDEVSEAVDELGDFTNWPAAVEEVLEVELPDGAAGIVAECVQHFVAVLGAEVISLRE